MPQSPKNKMFALGLPDNEETSFSQHSVSNELNKLENLVNVIFLEEKKNGVIDEDAVLDRDAPQGDDLVIFRYENEIGESTIFAQIETVNFL